MYNPIDCPHCGAEVIPTGAESIDCPVCGARIYLEWDDVNKEYYVWESSAGSMPDCCSACGGPYPDCKISCKIFDD